jgi:hypothetical protein
LCDIQESASSADVCGSKHDQKWRAVEFLSIWVDLSSDLGLIPPVINSSERGFWSTEHGEVRVALSRCHLLAIAGERPRSHFRYSCRQFRARRGHLPSSLPKLCPPLQAFLRS